MNAPNRLRELHKIVYAYTHLPSQEKFAKLSVALTKDPCDVVRHEAAFLIGELEPATKGIMEALKKACADESVLVRHEVAITLAKFPGEKARALLINLARDSSEEVRRSAIYGIEDMFCRLE